VAVVRVATSQISDWDSFHDVFAGALRFPDYYGRNRDAFVDLIHFPDAADVGVDVGIGEALTLYLDEPGEVFGARCPEQYDFLVDAVGTANAAGIDRGEWVTLALAFPRA
jgi:hypothetical protein